MKGRTDTYVHDVSGRALFFMSHPLNDSLARAIPTMVEEIRAVHGSEPFTVVFDRGGYSGELFRWLTDQGVGFLTYLKGRKAKRRYARNRFVRGWFEVDGKRTVYRLYEKKTRVTKCGLVRTAVMLGEDGAQIPVLTNLDATVRAAKVVHCLRLRWAQENSLKYLREHYAIDEIVQYGASPEEQERSVENPRRLQLNQKIRELRKDIESLQAELGRCVDGDATRRD